MIIMVLIVTVLLLIPEMNPDNFFPLLDSRWNSILWSSFDIYSLPFGEAVLFTMVFPYVLPIRQRTMGIIKAFLVGGGILLLVAATDVAILGPLLVENTFPTFSSFSEILVLNMSFGPFFAGIFILVSYIKVALCLYVASSGLGQWLNLKDYRPLIWPLVLIMISLAPNIYENVTDTFFFASYIWPLYSILFNLLIPLALLVISFFKAKTN